MKILCSVCYQPLILHEYPDHATYAEPCECAQDREREVAAEAAKHTAKHLTEFFSIMVETAVELVALDGSDSKEDLDNMYKQLLPVIIEEAETDFDEDPYDSLDMD